MKKTDENVPSRESLPMDRLRSLIRSARRRVFLASPVVDVEKVGALIQEARSRGVAVRILTEIRDNRSRGSSPSIPTWGLDGPGEDRALNHHFAGLRELANTGAQIRALNCFCHLKCWVADKHTAMIGSVNLTANALGTGSDPSIEVLQSLEGSLAQRISGGADRLWRSAPWHLHGGGGTNTVQERQREEPVSIKDDGILFQLPGPDDQLLEKWAQAIDTSNDTVQLVTMSAYGWKQMPMLCRSIRSALERGVRVDLAHRAECRVPHPDDDGWLASLIKAGMGVSPVPKLHAKGLVVDGYWTGLTSGNLNPYSFVPRHSSDHAELAVWGMGTEFSTSRKRLLSLRDEHSECCGA